MYELISDVALAIHIAYLIPTNDFQKVLLKIPRSMSLFLVLDIPDSVPY